MQMWGANEVAGLEGKANGHWLAIHAQEEGPDAAGLDCMVEYLGCHGGLPSYKNGPSNGWNWAIIEQQKGPQIGPKEMGLEPTKRMKE